jgi:hypothetical protein
MKYLKGALEKQSRCPHESLSKEVIMGQKTGDLVCNSCRDTFMSTEKITPVEYRHEMIVTPHALLVALKVNKDLELRQDPTSDFIQYDWALVSKTTGKVVIPVAADVAEDCVAKRHIIQPE